MERNGPWTRLTTSERREKSTVETAGGRKWEKGKGRGRRAQSKEEKKKGGHISELVTRKHHRSDVTRPLPEPCIEGSKEHSATHQEQGDSCRLSE